PWPGGSARVGVCAGPRQPQAGLTGLPILQSPGEYRRLPIGMLFVRLFFFKKCQFSESTHMLEPSVPAGNGETFHSSPTKAQQLSRGCNAVASPTREEGNSIGHPIQDSV